MSLCVLCHAGGLAAPPAANEAADLEAAPAANEAEDLEAVNPWAMLLRTFLPWINAGQVPDYQQQDEEAEDGMNDSGNGLLGAEEEVMGEADGADAAADEEDDLD